ncbi:MAG: hypothetical protein U5K00_17285 [Melioribacteraceae bacterium]|nr:hypothetical protein [Melioribacteraceae bacterium]
MNHEKKQELYDKKHMVYDYDNDGRSEWFEITNREYEKRATVLFRMNRDVLYDEFSVSGRTDIRWLRFDDLNGDKKDDLIMFSVYRDSVYLSIINLHTLQFIKKEKFIVSREAESDQFWDVVCYYIGRIENELFFFISSGYSHKPRLFLSYSIEEERVNNNFYVASPFRDHYIADINNDGKDEIVSIGGGTGNRPNEKFTDMTSWIFVLGSDLEFLVSPINIGHYPNAGVQSNLLEKGKKHLILISQNVNTATGEKSKLILFDDSLRTIKRL